MHVRPPAPAPAPRPLASETVGRCLVCRGPLVVDLHLDVIPGPAIGFAIVERPRCNCATTPPHSQG